MWKDIDYMYAVSTDGLVINKMTGKFLSQQPSGKISKYKPNKPRYLTVSLHGRKFFVHRLVAIAFIPNPDNLPQVNHIDGIRNHNWASNLEWVTNRENVIKAYEQNLIHVNSGFDHHCCTHTPDEVRLAMKMLESGKYTYKEICEATGYSDGTISAIKNGEIWKDLSKDYNIPKTKKRVNLNDYYKPIEDLILLGYSTRKIRKIYPIEDLDSQQWRSLVYNRKRSLKSRGLL